jgi:sulfotransferase family protein
MVPMHDSTVEIEPAMAFIVGHYKSGSTWLANLLSLHPAIRCIGETSIFPYVTSSSDFRQCTEKLFTKSFWSEGGMRGLPRHRLSKWARPLLKAWKPALRSEERPTTLMDLSVVNQIRLRRILLQSRSKEDYCERFFQFLRSSLQANGFLIEKNNNIFQVPFIRSTFPQAKLLAIHRDGRDVVVSEKFFLANEERRTVSLRGSVLDWRKKMEAHRSYVREHGIYSCSYESLLRDGETTVRGILTFLGLGADRATLDDMLRRSSFKFTTGRDNGREKSTSFYRKGIAGDWTNHFSQADKDLFKELAGDMLIELGYETDLNW